MITKEIKKHKEFIEENLNKKLENTNNLHIGCGMDYREGWVNIDLSDHKEIKVDKKVDLTKLPLPFEDNSFDFIFTAHTLEHLPGNITPLMIELWRILKTDGMLEIRVPHVSHYSALVGFEHRQVFAINGFNIFCDLDYLKYVPGFPKFKKPLFIKLKGVLKHQRVDNGKKLLVKKGFYYYVASIISKLASLNTNLCEKIWCYWVGGFQEMQIILKKIPQDIKLKEKYWEDIESLK